MLTLNNSSTKGFENKYVIRQTYLAHEDDLNIFGWFSTIFSSKEHYVKSKIFAKEDGCLLVHLRKIFAKEDICLLVPELLRCESLLKSALRAWYFAAVLF
jgi:hypothetical protein